MLPQQKQSIMISATMPEQLNLFASSRIGEHTVMKLDKESQLSDNLELMMLICSPFDKVATLICVIKEKGHLSMLQIFV